MDGSIVVVAAGYALALSLLGVVALRVLRQAEPRAAVAASRQLPLSLRLLRWPARLLGQLGGVLLPRSVRARWALQLRRAELDDLLTPRDWLGFCLSAAALAALVTATIAMTLSQTLTWGEALSSGWSLTAAALGFVLCRQSLTNRAKTNGRSVLRELPAYMDMLTLAVEGGCTLTVALRLAVEKAAPSPLRRAFESMLREIRSGRPRSEALELVSGRLDLPGLNEVTTALAQSENSGLSLGSILRSQAEQRNNERFARAERLAMEAPVKMLGPLILCIFPCTFIVIGFPIAVRLLGRVP